MSGASGELEWRRARWRMHLDHLQGAIGRLSQLGFMIKGWAVTLTAGMYVLSRPGSDTRTFGVTVVALLLFAALDGWLLTRERRLIHRYEAVAGDPEAWDGGLSIRAALAAQGMDAGGLRSALHLGLYGALIAVTAIGWLVAR